MVEFQRRHFNWFVVMIVDLNLSEQQTERLINKLKRTNANFNTSRFRSALSSEYSASGI